MEMMCQRIATAAYNFAGLLEIEISLPAVRLNDGLCHGGNIRFCAHENASFQSHRDQHLLNADLDFRVVVSLPTW